MTTRTPPEYDKFKSNDPFPDIDPALLNSADLTDYIKTVHLVEPFREENLKSASYEVPFSGTVYWWDLNNKSLVRKEIKAKGDVFALESNSIAFIHLDTRFFLPDYIALRFNLRITHVHQGLLLGTGPLVDPGFCGRLLVPLHNLTANKYILVHGNGFIWVEFTKLSNNERWKATSPLSRTGKYVPFPEHKKFIDAETYFRSANEGESIVSSIPEAIRQSKEEAVAAANSAKSAQAEVAKASGRLNWGIFGGMLGLVIAIIVGGLALIQIFQSTLDSKTRASEAISRASIESLRKEVEALRASVGKGNAETSRIDVTVKTEPASSSVPRKRKQVESK